MSWEPVNIDPTGRDEIGEEGDKWDDGKINELEAKLEELRRFNARLEESPDKHEENNIMLEKRNVKESTKKLVANQIYDKIITLINKRKERLDIKGGAKIMEPIRNYDSSI